MGDDQSQRCYGGFRYSTTHEDLISNDGLPAGLRRQSLAVFCYLADHQDHVVNKADIIDAVWTGVQVTDDSLIQCISDIRKIIGDTDHRVLKTIPRRGYMLVSDSVPAVVDDSEVDVNAKIRRTSGAAATSATGTTQTRIFTLALLGLLSVGIVAAQFWWQDDQISDVNNDTGIPTLSIESQHQSEEHPLPIAKTLLAELRIGLNRYRTVQLVDSDAADFVLTLVNPDSELEAPRVAVELKITGNNTLVLAQSYSFPDNSEAAQQLGVRLAAAIASPGIGAIDNRLLASSKLKPIEQISKAECYAHGYGCSKCSGEEDNITVRAEACLAALLEDDPNDSRAWALQATIYAHQYWWANTLAEPLRSTLALRRELPQKAIQAASTAEQLSDGDDSSVYWGMAEAYYASCQPDKLHAAVQRGLEINPDDPNLLASFGNWLSYSGRWDEGSELTRRALAIEPKNQGKWWWMGIAKTHYFKQEYAQAYAAFLNAYNERNWVSHLQLAYTLPHLGRFSEAQRSVDSLVRLYPGMTIEKALETYEILCFPDSFLDDMKHALEEAGLPSRGDSKNFSNIELPRAKTIHLNGIDMEYLDVGSGETVLFVHGAISDYRSWGYYMVPVSAGHRYLSYSRRYFGTQPWQDSGELFSVEVFANDLIALIEALDTGPVHLVSWSSGVRTALTVSILRPDLVKSAIHFEPVEDNIFGDDASIKQLQSEFYDKWAVVDERLNADDNEGAGQRMLELVFELEPGEFDQEKEMQKEVVRQNTRTLPVQFTMYAQDKIQLTCEFVSQVKVPTLIVKGGTTNSYWQRMAERFTACIPSASLSTIEGVNHRAPIEAIDQLSTLILDFVGLNSNQ